MDTKGNATKTFNFHQILKAFSGTIPSSSAEIYRQINRLIKSGDITRTERNTYILGTTKRIKSALQKIAVRYN